VLLLEFENKAFSFPRQKLISKQAVNKKRKNFIFCFEFEAMPGASNEYTGIKPFLPNSIQIKFSSSLHNLSGMMTCLYVDYTELFLETSGL
jgi:hypothetical protein